MYAPYYKNAIDMSGREIVHKQDNSRKLTHKDILYEWWKEHRNKLSWIDLFSMIFPVFERDQLHVSEDNIKNIEAYTNLSYMSTVETVEVAFSNVPLKKYSSNVNYGIPENIPGLSEIPIAGYIRDNFMGSQRNSDGKTVSTVDNNWCHSGGTVLPRISHLFNTYYAVFTSSSGSSTATAAYPKLYAAIYEGITEIYKTEHFQISPLFFTEAGLPASIPRPGVTPQLHYFSEAAAAAAKASAGI